MASVWVGSITAPQGPRHAPGQEPGPMKEVSPGAWRWRNVNAIFQTTGLGSETVFQYFENLQLVSSSDGVLAMVSLTHEGSLLSVMA